MTNPSGILIPSDNIGGWHQVLALDFDKDIAPGKVIGDSSFAGKMSAYPTGWRTTKPWQVGKYDNTRLECKDSTLRVPIYTGTDGVPRVCALTPRLSPLAPYGVKSARISICFRIAHHLPGYKMVPLLWPDSGLRTDGEIDFPECDLDGSLAMGFMHRQGATSGSDQDWAKSTVDPADGRWHVATVNYKSGSWRTPVCEFILDKVNLRASSPITQRIPNGPMHWVIQFEPVLGTYDKPDPAVSGVIEIDWLVGYTAA